MKLDKNLLRSCEKLIKTWDEDNIKIAFIIMGKNMDIDEMTTALYTMDLRPKKIYSIFLPDKFINIYVSNTPPAVYEALPERRVLNHEIGIKIDSYE